MDAGHGSLRETVVVRRRLLWATERLFVLKTPHPRPLAATSPRRSGAADPYPEARTRFEKATGVPALDSNRAVAVACDVLVLAVKPQVMPAVLAELRPAITPRHLVISIAAGLTLKTLADGLGSET